MRIDEEPEKFCLRYLYKATFLILLIHFVLLLLKQNKGNKRAGKDDEHPFKIEKMPQITQIGTAFSV